MAQRFALIVLGIIAVIQLTIATDIAGPSSVPSSKTGTGGPTFSRSRRVAGDLSGPSSAPSSKTGTSGPTFPRPRRAADNQQPSQPSYTEITRSISVNRINEHPSDNTVKVSVNNNVQVRTRRAPTKPNETPMFLRSRRAVQGNYETQSHTEITGSPSVIRINEHPSVDTQVRVRVNNNVEIRTRRAATELAKAPAPSKPQVQQPKKTADKNEKYVPDLGSK